MTPGLGAACLTKPTLGGPWTKYRCSACYGASCVPSECDIGPPTRRRVLGTGCATGDYCAVTLESNATSG